MRFIRLAYYVLDTYIIENRREYFVDNTLTLCHKQKKLGQFFSSSLQICNINIFELLDDFILYIDTGQYVRYLKLIQIES